MTDTPLHIPEWNAMLANIAPVGDQLLNRWGRIDPSADDRRNLLRLAPFAVANGYLSHVALDPARPTWTPCWNISMNMGGACPDYTYRTTDEDPAATAYPLFAEPTASPRLASKAMNCSAMRVRPPWRRCSIAWTS